MFPKQAARDIGKYYFELKIFMLDNILKTNYTIITFYHRGFGSRKNSARVLAGKSERNLQNS